MRRGSELADLTSLAQARGLPVSTVARHLLLQALNPSSGLTGAIERLEQDLSALRLAAASHSGDVRARSGAERQRPS